MALKIINNTANLISNNSDMEMNTQKCTSQVQYLQIDATLAPNFDTLKNKNLNQNSAKSSNSSFSTQEDSDMEIDETPIDNMIETAQQVGKEYGSGIYRTLIEKESGMEMKGGQLDNHEIQGKHRKQMIAWMVEVMEVFKCPNETFFLAVSIMDRYFFHSKRSLKLEDLHISGVICMFIASKYSEVEHLSLDLVYQKVVHKKISKTLLKKKEMEILKTLKFNISKPTLHEVLLTYFETSELLNENMSEELKKVLLEKTMKYLKESMMDRRLSFEVRPSQLMTATMLVAMRDLEKESGEVLLDVPFYTKISEEFIYPEETIVKIGERVSALIANLQ